MVKHKEGIGDKEMGEIGYDLLKHGSKKKKRKSPSLNSGAEENLVSCTIDPSLKVHVPKDNRVDVGNVLDDNLKAKLNVWLEKDGDEVAKPVEGDIPKDGKLQKKVYKSQKSSKNSENNAKEQSENGKTPMGDVTCEENPPALVTFQAKEPTGDTEEPNVQKRSHGRGNKGQRIAGPKSAIGKSPAHRSSLKRVSTRTPEASHIADPIQTTEQVHNASTDAQQDTTRTNPFGQPQSKVPEGTGIPKTSDLPHAASKLNFAGIFRENRVVGKGIKLKFYDTKEEDAILDASDDVPISENWGFCLIGCFTGSFPGRAALDSIVKGWGVQCKVTPYGKGGWTVFRFMNEFSRLHVFHGGPYMAYGKTLMLKLIEEKTIMTKDLFMKVPTWVLLHDVPLHVWGESGLSKISSKFGYPHYTDQVTKDRSRMSYARCLIEVDISKRPKMEVGVQMSGNRRYTQYVSYENFPLFCCDCRMHGHNYFNCPKREDIDHGKEDPKNIPSGHRPGPNLSKGGQTSNPKGARPKPNIAMKGQHKTNPSQAYRPKTLNSNPGKAQLQEPSSESYTIPGLKQNPISVSNKFGGLAEIGESSGVDKDENETEINPPQSKEGEKGDQVIKQTPPQSKEGGKGDQVIKQTPPQSKEATEKDTVNKVDKNSKAVKLDKVIKSNPPQSKEGNTSDKGNKGRKQTKSDRAAKANPPQSKEGNIECKVTEGDKGTKGNNVAKRDNVTKDNPPQSKEGNREDKVTIGSRVTNGKKGVKGDNVTKDKPPQSKEGGKDNKATKDDTTHSVKGNEEDKVNGDNDPPQSKEGNVTLESVSDESETESESESESEEDVSGDPVSDEEVSDEDASPQDREERQQVGTENKAMKTSRRGGAVSSSVGQ